mmetsp:Transcript_109017/g.339762  ORF Transcript_109017/g.339762 Transcript_109017/m.339762 type:complete len:277 (+) Transcript_109017:45-875(+)
MRHEGLVGVDSSPGYDADPVGFLDFETARPSLPPHPVPSEPVHVRGLSPLCWRYPGRDVGAVEAATASPPPCPRLLSCRDRPPPHFLAATPVSAEVCTDSCRNKTCGSLLGITFSDVSTNPGSARTSSIGTSHTAHASERSWAAMGGAVPLRGGASCGPAAGRSHPARHASLSRGPGPPNARAPLAEVEPLDDSSPSPLAEDGTGSTADTCYLFALNDDAGENLRMPKHRPIGQAAAGSVSSRARQQREEVEAQLGSGESRGRRRSSAPEKHWLLR